MEEAERLQKLPTYIFAKQDKLKAEMRKKGADLIDLGLGSPNIAPPKEVIDEAKKNAGLILVPYPQGDGFVKVGLFAM